jgi:transcriptional regulator with XRE-family HTH domain
MTEPIRITLRAARVNAGFTQLEVAKRLKVSNKTVMKWETGEAEPSFATLQALSLIYQLPMDCIILPTKSS